MRFLLPSVALGLVSGAVAVKNWDVNVGKGGLFEFDPPTIVGALAGDTLTYHFFSKNHSVIQSSFADPCHPLAGGFFSGFTPSASPDTPGPTTWTVQVNATTPLWMYCGQGNHCQKGMVHSVNAATTGNTFDVYKAVAANATASTSPPNGLPVGGLRKLHVDVAPGKNLTFSPNNITELVGTVVEFSFNPANHSVVQSSFADPCHPLTGGGFSSGFIPTTVTPSGVLFDILINDTKPIWFYCAQTVKTHCQAGMVGSINAPIVGNTLEAFTAKAAVAGLSTIPPTAPIGGILTVNGTSSFSFNGAVLNTTPPPSSNPDPVTAVPPPGTTISSNVSTSAGGAPPSNYGWAPTVTDSGVAALQLLQFLDEILLDILVKGVNRLATGDWKGLYPVSITNAIESLLAQALVHRSTATDSLQHYSKPLLKACEYSYAGSSVSDFTDTVLTILLLDIGLLVDTIVLQAATDPWMIAPLATTLGSKARMSGLINMMQNHLTAPAPREARVPGALAYSYAMQHFVVTNSCSDTMPIKTITPKMQVSKQNRTGDAQNRLASITITIDTAASPGNMWVAWTGAWGSTEYTPVVQGTASVPTDLYGHVWGTLVNAIPTAGGPAVDMVASAVAGPELFWVSAP